MKRPIISRIWKMRIASVILAPTLFLLLAEGALRFFDYGDPTTFFVPIEGQVKVTGNSRYTYQYFPKQLAREPDLIRMEKEKPEDVYRIFVMGGSAARGTPDPRFGLGRILEVMLEESYPGRRFEVVNTAMVAINSHVVMRIASECADYDPDLFVIYMGNNEAVGPFGVGTEYSQQTPGRGMMAMSLAAKSTRTGQLLKNLVDGVGDESAQAEWLGMEAFSKYRVSAGDPRLQRVYEHFEANLKDIVKTARDAGIPMILCTVPVNLRNCAPLASDHSSDLDDKQKALWKHHYDEGIALAMGQRWQDAEKKFSQAAEIDNQYAELHYRRAKCALALEDIKTAQAYFESARDLDTLRFRTDSKINGIIRETGNLESVTLLDAEERFKSLPQATHGIPGDELFYEHVHFRFEGNFELARMVFEETAKQLGSAPVNAPPSLERCAELLGLSEIDRYQMATSMMNLVIKPPFLDQLDYYERCEKIHSQIRSLREFTNPEGLREAEKMLATALESRPNDLHGQFSLAQLQLQQKKHSDAEKTIRALMEKLPNRADLYSLLGQALLYQERETDAWEAFEKSIKLAAQPLDYMSLAAEHYEQSGDKDRALELLQRALDAQPRAASRHNRMAEFLLDSGDKEQAIKELELADTLLPNNGNILFNLSRAYFETGDMDKAVEKLRATLKANPFHLGARKQLGLVLKKRGNFEEAVEHLTMVIRQEPDQLDLRLHRGEAYISLMQFDEAESDYRTVLESSPHQLSASLGLAWSLAVRQKATPDERAEAIKLAQEVVTATGRRAAKPLDVLAVAWAASGNFEKARDCAKDARWLLTNGQDIVLDAQIERRLRLYEKNKPYLLPKEKEK